MNKISFHKLGPAVLAALLATPFAANAESTLQSGAGPQSTSARVDFQITIPRFVSLRVGSAAGTIDLISFAPTAAQVESGLPVSGAGGDLGGGAVTASVRGNGGDVTLAAVTAGAISNGASTISWSEITTATSNALLTPPALLDGPAVSTTVSAAANGVANQTATWTYTYDNSAVVPAGTYGGVAVNNGRVTYTASVL